MNTPADVFASDRMAGMNGAPDASGRDMTGMDMGDAASIGDNVSDALLPAFRPWSLNEFVLTFTM